MSNQNGQTPEHATQADLDALGRKLDSMRNKHQPAADPAPKHSALGLAWRISTELVVSVLVGGGLGYGIDHLAGSKPWGLLIGLGFGFAAALRNIMRLSEKMAQTEAERLAEADTPKT